jgi:hypothetical protein
LFIGGRPLQGLCPASEVNDAGCPEKPDHLIPDSVIFFLINVLPTKKKVS